MSFSRRDPNAGCTLARRRLGGLALATVMGVTPLALPAVMVATQHAAYANEDEQVWSSRNWTQQDDTHATAEIGYEVRTYDPCKGCGGAEVSWVSQEWQCDHLNFYEYNNVPYQDEWGNSVDSWDWRITGTGPC